jgi:hypothetical protein
VEFTCSQIRAVLDVFQNASIAESMRSFRLELASRHIHLLSFPQFLNLTVLSLTLTGFGHLYHKKIDQDFPNADHITGLVVSFLALEQLSINTNNTWCIRVHNVPSLTSLELDLSDVGGSINDEPGLSAMTLYDVLWRSTIFFNDFCSVSKTLTCVRLCVRAEWLRDVHELCFPSLIDIVLRVSQSYGVVTFDPSVCLVAPCLETAHFLLSTSRCISFSRSTFPLSVKHFVLKTPVSSFAAAEGRTTQEFIVHFQHLRTAILSVHSLQCDTGRVPSNICWPELRTLVVIVDWKIGEFLRCLKLPALEKLYLVFPSWYRMEETGYWSDSDISEEHVDSVDSDSLDDEDDVDGDYSVEEFTMQSHLVFHHCHRMYQEQREALVALYPHATVVEGKYRCVIGREDFVTLY